MAERPAPVHDWLDDAVAAQAPWMEKLLVQLVERATTLGCEDAGQREMRRAFTECGLDPVDIPMDADAVRADPGHSPFSWGVRGKRNVVATWAGTGGGRSVILNGHIDVVPPAAEELWTGRPFLARRDGDLLYGRGAGDMKAGLVAMTGAVRALREAGLRLGGDVHLQSVVEEECTGNGTLQCLLAGAGADADAAVVTEPHYDHLTVAQVGVLWFHIDIRGIAAHAGRASLGPNAFDAAYHVLQGLRELEAELNAERANYPHYRALEHPINLNPGVVTSGDWASTVPAKCTLSCRLAMYPGQPVAELRERVERVVDSAAAGDAFLRAHPPVIRYDGFSCEGAVVDENEPVIEALTDAYAAVRGSPPPLRSITSTTDARHFIRRGIPAVCFGPEARNLHGVDECVSVSSMLAVAQVLARFLLAWCGPPVRDSDGARDQRTAG